MEERRFAWNIGNIDLDDINNEDSGNWKKYMYCWKSSNLKNKLILLRHMIHVRNYEKNNAYTIMRLYILHNITGNIIIIMVIRR